MQSPKKSLHVLERDSELVSGMSRGTPEVLYLIICSLSEVISSFLFSEIDSWKSL